MIDAPEMQIATRLDALHRPTEDDVASALKTSTSHGSRVRARSAICTSLPELGEALEDGATTGERIDIAGAAAALDDRRFRDWMAQLARQRAATRLRWWNDGDGMWRLDGRFDPASGAALQGALRRTTEALFAAGAAGAAPDVPTDPLDRQQWLQAQALLQLVDGAAVNVGTRSGGGPDITVVIDARTLLHDEHADTRLDTGGFGLPIETIRRWVCLGDVTPIVVGTDGTRLMLGRTTRLASAA